jgi:uncharacterized membrane protein (DUF2068 family)
MRRPPESNFLKFIVLYKTLMGITETVISVSFFKLFGRNLDAECKGFARAIHLDTENRIIASAIKRLGMIGNDTLIVITLILLLFGVLNLIEAWGLHRRRMWGEWLTVIATSLLIPFEIYEIFIGVTAFKVFILVMNVIIVYYLARHKELFRIKQ